MYIAKAVHGLRACFYLQKLFLSFYAFAASWWWRKYWLYCLCILGQTDVNWLGFEVKGQGHRLTKCAKITFWNVFAWYSCHSV